ncbi:MAG: Rrf2 family transcriptional regulator [Lachnospiraceae bacterium]|nr:Rrf2 family transcriptional regulator [Lachnospiraceae bacterium]
MMFSTKGRYALRLMLDIAMNEGEGPVRIKDIGSRQGISDKYLEQIISILNRSGYVRSIRGPHGGYKLTKSPKEYTAGMILRVTEGSLAPVSCLEFEDNTCERRDECVTLELWKRIDDAVSGVVDHITLEDMLSWKNDKQ